MNGARARIDYALKHNPLVSKAFRMLASAAVRAMGIFTPMDEKAVLFSAHTRKYNDSPRAIYERMRTDPRFKDFTFYWALDDAEGTEVPGPCVKLVPDTMNYFRTALRCKYWITCVNIERGLRFKRRKTVYLNTWHGIPIKTVGNEAKGRADYDFSYIDYFCASGEYEIDLYRRSFNVPEEHIIRTGLPRNDVLYHPDAVDRRALLRRLGLPEDKKIILYAPTWRDSRDGGKSYTIAPPMDLDKWAKALGQDYVLLFRTHPYTNALLGVEFNDFVRDFTDYPVVNDLLLAADVLISDYSAVMFDYCVLERPILSFAYDCDAYAAKRGFAMDPRTEMPGGICETEDEVIARILNLDPEAEAEAVRRFKQKYVTYGGHATEECIQAMFG